MPIKIQGDLPVKEILERENIFVMDEGRAVHQDIRPLQILILNLMPLKEETELQLLRSLSNTSLQEDVTFIADEKIFEEIPVKKEVKATVSGLYITGVRGLRGPLEKPQGKQKKSLRAKLQSQYDKANKKLQEEKQKK